MPTKYPSDVTCSNLKKLVHNMFVSVIENYLITTDAEAM